MIFAVVWKRYILRTFRKREKLIFFQSKCSWRKTSYTPIVRFLCIIQRSTHPGGKLVQNLHSIPSKANLKSLFVVKMESLSGDNFSKSIL